MPVGAPSFSEALRWGVETYHVLKKVLHDRGLSTRPSATRAASRPTCRANEDAIQFLVEAIDAAGYVPGEEIAIAMDPAISEIYRGRPLPPRRRGQGAQRRRAGRLLDPPRRHVPDRVDRGRHGRGRLGRLGGAHRGRSATGSSSSATTCSSPTPAGCSRASSAASPTPCSSRSTRSAASPRRSTPSSWRPGSGYSSVMSHRSGETEDTTIADLAVATNCGQIKTGAPARSDRVAKYNQLLRLEADLGEAAAFRGRKALSRAAMTCRVPRIGGASCAQSSGDRGRDEDADPQAAARARPTPGGRASATSPGRSPGSSGSPRTDVRRSCSAPSASSSPAAIGAALFGLPVRTWFAQDDEIARLEHQLTSCEAVNDDLQQEVDDAADRRRHHRGGPRDARLPAGQRAPRDRRRPARPARRPARRVAVRAGRADHPAPGRGRRGRNRPGAERGAALASPP